MQFRESSFWQYKVYADIRRGSGKETSNDSGVARQCTCCCCMLKFIGCVRNKLAGSSDVGFGHDGRMCGLLRR